MSVLDMDISVRRTPQSIRKRRFAVVRRGFDPDQVGVYLDQIAGWIEQLEAELHTAREELSAAERRAEHPVDPYGKLGERVAELLRTAEHQAERIGREAEEEASRKLDDLQTECERIRDEATTRGDRLRREAEDEANRMRGEAAQILERARTEAASVMAALTGQRDLLVAELRSTRERLSDLVDAIDATVGTTPSTSTGPVDPWAGFVPRSRDTRSRGPWAEDLEGGAGAESKSAPSGDTQPDLPVPMVDPFEPPAAEAPLFEDLTAGPSYEGRGTGHPLFEDDEPELRPHPTYDETRYLSTADSNGADAASEGPAGGRHGLFDDDDVEVIGEPTSFELPAGEAIDLAGLPYDEDEDPEITPTIDLSLPEIPSFDDDQDEDEAEEH